jgi:hypothetical protein
MTPPCLPEPFLQGLEPATRNRLLAAAAGWMGFLPGMELAESAAAAAPREPAPALLAGLVALLGQTPTAQAAAASHLSTAMAAAERLDPWGLGLLEAAGLWQAGELGAALRRLERLGWEFPAAPLVLKIVEWLCYLRGQELHGPRLLELARWFRRHHGDHADVLAIEAFALELGGALEEAEATARTAIERRDLNPWADHTLMHALHRQGRLREAGRWVAQRADGWLAAAPPMRLHNLWHGSLIALEAGLPDRARMALPAVAGPEGSGDLLDRIALAWRLELAGSDASAVWPSLADALEALDPLPVVPFVAAHHGWCLARAGRSAALRRLFAAAAKLADDETGLEADWCWRPAGLAILRGVVALARDDATAALADLGPVRVWFGHAGGSDAQNQVLHQSLLVAAARAGDRALVRRLAEGLRGSRRRRTPLDRYWLTPGRSPGAPS